MNPRRAIILPIVLVMIGLLALTMAGFIFFVRAETAGIRAAADGKQAQLAAETGLEFVISTLRTSKHDITAWFDKPDVFRHMLVWGESFNRQSDPVRETGSRKQYFERSPNRPPAWRFSVVADRVDGPVDAIRFGITPETGKLNINVASDEQIRNLLTPVLVGLRIENAPQIIDAILDWRDADGAPRQNGAENEYYNTLTPPYNTKNGRFDTIEELLLVKGVTAAILWGEDANRNGVLDRNEDDGDASFPEYDNGDGILDRGIAPYITVGSREPDTALDNKPRIPLGGGGGAMALLMQKYFPNGELSEATQQFLMSLQSRGVDLSMLRSPADLFPLGEDEELDLSIPEGAPRNMQGPGVQQALGGDALKGLQDQLQGAGGKTDDAGGKSDGKSGGASTGGSGTNAGGGKSGAGGGTSGGSNGAGGSGGKKGGGTSKVAEREQNRDTKPPAGGNAGGGKGGKGDTKPPAGGSGGKGPSNNGNGGGKNPKGGDTGGKNPSGDTGGKQPTDDGGGKNPKGDDTGGKQPDDGGKQPQDGGKGEGDGKQGDGAGANSADQRREEALSKWKEVLRGSPIQLAEMPYIMDRFTTRAASGGSQGSLIEGLININTAPARVLSLIPGITPDAVGAILATRTAADPGTLSTTAWPLTTGAIDAPTFKRIAPYITTKSYQFHVEVVGYADHSKLMRRYEWIIEMIGPLAQVKYFRDLSALGMGWPVDTETQVVNGR